MADLIYTNFFSVSTAIGSVFYFSAGAFLLLAIPKRSAAATNLGLAYLFSALLAFPFVLAHAVYHEYAAYHRWMTVLMALLNPIFFARFFYCFPNDRPARWKNVVLYVQLALAFAFTAYFIFATYGRGYEYHFNGHYWNRHSKTASTVVGLAILLSQFHVAGAGIFSAIRADNTRERLAIGGMTFATFTCTLIPGIANIATRQNRLEYETFMTVLILMSVLGFFFVAVLFINNARDRTTFMAKIVGLSFVLFLVLLVFLSSQAFSDREEAYDAVHREQTARLTVDPAYAKQLPDLRYVVVSDLSGNVVKFESDEAQLPPELNPITARKAEFEAHPYATGEFSETLTDPAALGKRQYRMHPETGEHFVVFAALDSRNERLYEAAYRYRTYRAFIHTVGVRYTIILIGVSLIILGGFRFFFLGALITPLRRLLDGLGQVRAGETEVTIPVGVKDEIGYVTESFNRMVRSVRGAKMRLQKYTDELEDRVRDRTRELEQTLDRVQELKLQQDGDYFLTALLIKPLSGNNVTSETVQLDFLTEQKKKFSFRRWEEELGGDICSAHTVYLEGRAFTVFVNADAMGKSVQGAGGALVFGAVFESLMERTRIVAAFNQLSPERWLKNAFTELHKVFESFDGTMLISLVLGLIDDESGMLYFVNAEHPHPVLYRDGKARFLGLDGMLRKLGWTLMAQTQFGIQTQQLLPGDVLIIGSDGRDDVQLASDDKGQRIINEDENLFLKHVENAGGDLKNILAEVNRAGQLTDDLSLIRVAYRAGEEPADRHVTSDETRSTVTRVRELMRQGDYATAESLLKPGPDGRDPEPEILRELVRLHGELKNHEQALNFAERYIVLRPGDTNMIYSAGVLARKLGRPDRAADFAERVRLRSRSMVPNLLNLAQAYLILKNHDRAIKILQEALAVEPANERAQKLMNLARSG